MKERKRDKENRNDRREEKAQEGEERIKDKEKRNEKREVKAQEPEDRPVPSGRPFGVPNMCQSEHDLSTAPQLEEGTKEREKKREKAKMLSVQDDSMRHEDDRCVAFAGTVMHSDVFQRDTTEGSRGDLVAL